MLREDLIFRLYRASRFTSNGLLDNPRNLSPSFSFLNDPRNNFQQVQEWLFRQVYKDTALAARFISLKPTINSDLDTSSVDSSSKSQLNLSTL